MNAQVSIAELRTKTAEFFRSRKMKVPANWTDQQLMLFDKHVLTSYRQKVRHGGTGKSQLRAFGAPKSAPEPTPTVSEDEREEVKRLLDFARTLLP